jgi:hypothetical protein
MLDLSDSLAVFRIVRPPTRQRLKIEILPAGVDALFANDFAHVLNKPRACRHIA